MKTKILNLIKHIAKKFDLFVYAKTPKNKNSVTSDLFIWSNKHGFHTYFKLINIAYYATKEDSYIKDNCTIIFFRADGSEYKRLKMEIDGLRTIEIDIHKVIGSINEYGTFAVFHERNPQIFQDNNSFLAERGYVGYKTKIQKFRSYVHGNLDAVTIKSNGKVVPLASSLIKRRSFNIQYQFNIKNIYLLSLVNPTKRKQRFKINIIKKNTNEVITKCVNINPLGTYIYSLPKVDENAIIKISARVPLPRPIIFKRNRATIDAFHA